MADNLFDNMAKGDDNVMPEKVLAVFLGDDGAGGLREPTGVKNKKGEDMFPLNTITDRIPDSLSVFDWDELPALLVIITAVPETPGDPIKGPRIFQITAMVYHRKPDDMKNVDSLVRQLASRVREVIRSQIFAGQNWGLVDSDISGYNKTGGTITRTLRTIYIREGLDKNIQVGDMSVRGLVTFEIEVPTRYFFKTVGA